MKLPQKTENATNNRKFMKSQVEKRRRERMNRSLDHLRMLLLLEPQGGEPKHRVEKAEILERTVLFLQNAATGDKTTAGGGGQKRSCRDGFFSCLQRAVRFLGPEGKGLSVVSALDATLAARFVRSDSEPACLHSGNFLPHAKFIQRVLRHKSKLRAGENSCAHPCPFPSHKRSPKVPQAKRQSRPEIRVKRGAAKQRSSQSSPVSHTLWRPWP